VTKGCKRPPAPPSPAAARPQVRQFMKGTEGPWAGNFANAICGSPTLYAHTNAGESSRVTVRATCSPAPGPSGLQSPLLPAINPLHLG
jgi:hypothetical protein